ncbi:hypothetical protein BGX38DRAFT_66279 [Terfezia claveryi]|nr:hypothetical protein BGX38DRAFT_66279 [Terfezia claveryi]
MEMDPEDRSAPATRPRDIFSPQHRIPRAPTPPTNSLADLLHLLNDRHREFILSLDQETRSNTSREEGDSPSIDSIMEDQLPSTTPVITQPESSSIRTSESLSSDDASPEALILDTATELDASPEDWNTGPSTTSDHAQASMEEVDPAAVDENHTGRPENQGFPSPPFELLLPIGGPFLTSAGFLRPGIAHFMTGDEYLDEGFNEGYDEPIIDIETDNFDFSRLCRRLSNYDYYPFDPTTVRLASLAAQIKALKRPEEVTREAMEMNGGDCQGIPWNNLGVTRDAFRVLRNRTYKNYRNVPHVAYTKLDPLPDNRHFFRFNRQENTKRIRVVHFQLRNLLSVTSRHDIFYSSEHCRIRRTELGSKESEIIIDLSTGVGGGSGTGTGSPVKITTMAARYGVVIAGGFSGEYAMKSLFSPFESKPIVGTVTRNDNGITNHVHSHLGRNSGSPVAVFSSNDNKLRVLDCYRNTFIGEQSFDWPINCSATSPDGRLRVVVGDHKDIVIVEADSGKILRTLEGHQDYGFSCAWSDDGYSIATGNQDRTVRIYDARNFSRSITQIGTNIAGVRTLRFSENGCGRRVLVCPEPADYVNVIDAVTWDGMQKFDFFGEIAGVELSPKGGEMFVANADFSVGGLMEFERCRDDRYDIWEGEDGARSRESGVEETSYLEDEDEEVLEEFSGRSTGSRSTVSTPIRQHRRRRQISSPSTPSSPYNRLPPPLPYSSQRLRGAVATPPHGQDISSPSDRTMSSPSASQIRLPASPSPFRTTAIGSGLWDNSNVTPSRFPLFPLPQFQGIERGRVPERRWRWVIRDWDDDASEDGEDEEPDVDTVVDVVGNDNEEEESEAEFARWKAENMREAMGREEDALGGRRRKRMGAEMGGVFV